jgi:RNA polymerase sigma-70 factor (ECF subfamily)
MRRLDDPPKTALYLALYEGYTAPEISDMLKTPVNTIYSWIARGKQQLREALSWTD